MEAMQYRYEARVHADSWFIRLYLWAWLADLASVDFCRLFWGYIFMPLNLLVRSVCAPFYYGFIGLRGLARRADNRLSAPSPKPRRSVTPPPSSPAPQRTRSKRDYTKLLTVAGRAADKAVAGCQATWRVIRWPVRVAMFACAGAVALLIVGLTVFGAYHLVGLIGMIAPPIAGWVVANAPAAGLTLAIVVVGLLVLAGLVRGGVYLAEDTPVGPAVKNGTLGFAGAMKTGAFGVKSRTCPKIVVVRDE